MNTFIRYFVKLITLQLPIIYYVLFVMGTAFLFILTKYRFKKSNAFALALSLLIGLLLISVPSFFLKEKNLTLTVFVHGPGGKQDAINNIAGKVVIDIGNKRESREIGKDGSATFLELPSSYRNQSVNIMVQQPGYEMAQSQQKHVLADTPVYITLQKDNSLGKLSGVVKNAAGTLPIVGAEVYIGNDTLLLTNAIGAFEILLPEKMRVAGSNTPYRLVVKKAGYTWKEELYHPGSNPIEIRLAKMKQ